MNDTTYKPATLPAPTNKNIPLTDIESSRPEIPPIIEGIEAGAFLGAQPFGVVVLNKGIDTDSYQLPTIADPPLPPAMPVDRLPANSSISVDDSQPWPIRGALDVRWARTISWVTDTAPAVVGVGNTVYFFAKTVDKRIFYNRSELGQGGQGWVEVPGGGLTDAAPAAGGVGNYMFMAVKGLDGRVWINQGEGPPFVGWAPTQ
jgi:hypothetical protein